MTGGLEKQGRIERGKERKERGKAREVNKVLTGWGTLASCPRQEETRDKRVPVAVAGSGPLAGKLAPEYPEWSGHQSQRRRIPARVAICCRKADPFQGPKLGLYLYFILYTTIKQPCPHTHSHTYCFTCHLQLLVPLCSSTLPTLESG